MKSKPFIFTKRYPILSIFSQYFPFSTHSRHSFDDSVTGCSAVYRHALIFQRPATIRWSPHLENTASFIGSVTREPARVNSKTFGVHTVLKVRSSNQPNSSFFRVLLLMWNGVAELALEHLKPNDFIYASGSLGSYTKPDAGGIPRLNYKLYVKEFKFVTQRSGYQGQKKLESVEANVGMQSNQNRLHLWQVFFANPNEWWDQRKRKLNPKQPDFKHKDTGEALWLSTYDPPWVRKQLQLLDSKMAGGSVGHHHSRVTTWVYDD